VEYQSKLQSKELDQLFDAILMLQSREECYRFFEDICTVSELRAIAQRLCVATLLRDNVTYHDIAQELGASTATISRVNRALSYGTGGYTLMLERMQQASKAENTDEQTK